jgi:hypothetical protein
MTSGASYMPSYDQKFSGQKRENNVQVQGVHFFLSVSSSSPLFAEFSGAFV